MKRIWIFNHYATNTFFDRGGRHYEFAKYLIRAGYSVRIFCASTVHNTDKNLIKNDCPYIEDFCDGIPYVFLKTRNYAGNGKQRVLNMIDYYRGLFSVTRHFEKPDVIIGSSVHPLACVAAIKLSKKYGCKNIAEIRDLWPESIVDYGIRGKNDPVIQILYKVEKWIYAKADAIIFTMEGGRDYIVEKGWDKVHGGPVDLGKVYHINNGVDLEMFDYNKEHYIFPDHDLDDPNTFKVVYTGSVRKVNNVGKLIDCALELKNNGADKIRIFIFGDGDERDCLSARVVDMGLHNVVLKGKVDKKQIPYILSKCDLCLMHGQLSPIARYGLSLNKSFDYMASGKPILSSYKPNYDYISANECGISENLTSAKHYANAIIRFYKMTDYEYQKYSENARHAAQKYDFRILTQKLLNACEVAGE